jgi:hypothetical protein
MINRAAAAASPLPFRLHPRADKDPELHRKGYPASAHAIDSNHIVLVSGNKEGDLLAETKAYNYSTVAFELGGTDADVFPMRNHFLAHRNSQELVTAVHRCLVRMNLYHIAHVDCVTLYDPLYGHHVLMRSATDFLPFQYGRLNASECFDTLSCLTIYLRPSFWAGVRFGSNEAARAHIIALL